MATQMTKVYGDELDFGVTESGLSNVLEQSSTVRKLGEVKEYKDKDGAVKSVYVTAEKDDREFTFETILKHGASTDYYVGKTMTIDGEACVVTAFEITESNEDAKKARITARTYSALSS